MTEQQIQAIEIESVEAEETEELTVESVIGELVGTLEDQNTAFRVATVINKAFQILGIEKEIPTQMMYNYTRNGMIVKGKKGKASEIRYTKDEVAAFATKYVNKHTN
jgi:hypothetical protein